MELPSIGQHAGGNAEGHVVCKGVVFHTELGGGAGQAGDLTITAIEEGAGKDSPGGKVELALEGKDDTEEAAEEATGREKVRKDIEAAGHGFLLVAHCYLT